MSYLAQWGHLYLVHFGAWISFCFGTTIYKNGLPELSQVKSLFKVATILSAFLAIFSSHSHNHYLNMVSGVQKVVQSKN